MTKNKKEKDKNVAWATRRAVASGGTALLSGLALSKVYSAIKKSKSKSFATNLKYNLPLAGFFGGMNFVEGMMEGSPENKAETSKKKDYGANIPWAASRGITSGVASLLMGVTIQSRLKEIERQSAKYKGAKNLPKKILKFWPVAAVGAATGFGKGYFEKKIEKSLKNRMDKKDAK